jgi:hypothetical protein
MYASNSKQCANGIVWEIYSKSQNVKEGHQEPLDIWNLTLDTLSNFPSKNSQNRENHSIVFRASPNNHDVIQGRKGLYIALCFPLFEGATGLGTYVRRELERETR